MRFIILLFMASSFVTACTSTQDMVYQDNSHPYADQSEGFMTQEPRTYREPNYTPSDFFFKSCSQTENGSHYSRTSYICDDR